MTPLRGAASLRISAKNTLSKNVLPLRCHTGAQVAGWSALTSLRFLRIKRHGDTIGVMSMRGLRRTDILWSIGLGALLEILVFFSLVPKDSTQPPTRFQELLGYTQAPGGGAFFLLFGTGLGHQLDKLPQPLGMILAAIGFAAVFLLQSAVMGIPVWLTIQTWKALRSHSLAPDTPSSR
jgi:hypothetical protein